MAGRIAAALAVLALTWPGQGSAHHPGHGGGGATIGVGFPGAFAGAPTSGVGGATTVGGVPEQRLAYAVQSISGGLAWHRGFGLDLSVPVVFASSGTKAPRVHLGSISAGARGSFLLGAGASAPRVTLAAAVQLPSTWAVERVRPGTVSVRPSIALSGRWRRLRLAGDFGATAGIGPEANSLVDGGVAAALQASERVGLGVGVRLTAAVAGELAAVVPPVSLDLSAGLSLRLAPRGTLTVAAGGSPVSGFGRSVHGTVGFDVDLGRLGPAPEHSGCTCDIDGEPLVL